MSDGINIPRIDGTAGKSSTTNPNPIGATLGNPETMKNVETALGNHAKNIGNAMVDALQNAGTTSEERQELLERDSLGARQQQ